MTHGIQVRLPTLSTNARNNYGAIFQQLQSDQTTLPGTGVVFCGLLPVTHPIIRRERRLPVE
jgi:hypothetical protein